MDGRVHFIVDGIKVGTLRDQVFDDGRVPRDDGQVQWGVALLVLLVEQTRLGLQDLLDAVQVLILGAIMQSGFSGSVLVRNAVRL